jgi:hypothetical protein
VPGTSTAATLTGLVTGHTTFSVRAFDVVGAGPVGSASYTVTGAAGQTYTSTVRGNHPSLFYRLGDTTPLGMTDSSGSGGTGYYNGANDSVYGQSGVEQNVRPGAIASDPNAGAVSDVGNGAASGGVGTGGVSYPSGDSARTVEVWMKTTANAFAFPVSTAPYGLVGLGSAAANDSFNVFASAPNQIEVSGAYDDQLFTTPTIDDGNWHLITVTFDGTNIQVYVDGVLAGSGTFSGVLNTTPGYPVVIGDSTFHQNAALGFTLDDVAIYPSVLSAAQVQSHYSAAGY